MLRIIYTCKIQIILQMFVEGTLRSLRNMDASLGTLWLHKMIQNYNALGPSGLLRASHGKLADSFPLWLDTK